MLNQSSPTIQTAVINAGQALSAVANLGAEALHGIVVPSTWTAAELTFQASIDGGATFQELQDDTGTAISVAVTAGALIVLDPTLWRAINCLKIRSGTLASPVNQVANATLSLVLGTVV